MMPSKDFALTHAFARRTFRGRRGVFFTVIALLLVILTFFLLSIDSAKQYQQNSLVYAVRLSTLNDFVEDMESDLSRALYIAGFRALLSIEQEVIGSGQYMDDSAVVLLEAVQNGTVNNVSAPLMENSTFPLWVSRIAQQAELIDVNVTISLENVTLDQDDPWSIRLHAFVRYNVTDGRQVSSWYREKNIDARVTIIGHEDPVYSVNTFGLVTNIVVPANVTDFVNTANNDTTNLRIHVNNSYYIASTLAPSFLMRLEGNLTASPYGIESLVNVGELEEQGISAQLRSSVDYLYFSNVSHSELRIENMSNTAEFDWFRLDASSLATYECTDLVIP